MSFFVKPYARFQGARFVLVVLVLVLDKILIFEHEDEDEYEDEKYQLRPPETYSLIASQPHSIPAF